MYPGVLQDHGLSALFRGVAPRMVSTGIGGAVFWPLHGFLKECIP